MTSANELEELRRANDCVGDLGSLDEALLLYLRTEKSTLEKALGADDRQRNVMPDSGGSFCGQDIPSRFYEELQNRLVLPRRRVRYVDNDLSPGKRFSKSLAGDAVYARRG